MFIYLASTEELAGLSYGKIGCTTDLYGRLGTYLTGCVPGMEPSRDLSYFGIWETTASTRDELFDMEEAVHEHFLQFRIMRRIPKDTEWFNFRGANPYEAVRTYMSTCQWVKCEVPPEEIKPSKNILPYLQKQYPANLNFIRNRAIRGTILNTLQAPIVGAIARFVASPDARAGYVIAPCGSGKTTMTCKGIAGVKRVIICCPSKQIQTQWQRTLAGENVLFVGSTGTTSVDEILATMSKPEYCIITTYMSSHLLADIISTDVELLILDEAHHMAGAIASEESGEGRTRKLLVAAAELGIKRLSLTYTPRFIKDGGDNYLSMDDAGVFGEQIAQLKIRDLITQGVLPDYRIWSLHDSEHEGAGIYGKAECIVRAWDASEVVRGVEMHVLHHLVVFAATIQEAKDLETYFKGNTTDTCVLRVEEGDKLEGPLQQFTAAKRAILVNCFVLNEGVDIPVANAVAITYPKQSRGQITQMILRAGRWYEGKSVFHVLIPTLGREDLSGFEEVLLALASADDKIRDEIVVRAVSEETAEHHRAAAAEALDVPPGCIMIENYESNRDAIKRCFFNIYKNLFPAKEAERIQRYCVDAGIDTSVEYERKRLPEFSADPRPKGVTWYDYLHPSDNAKDRMKCEEFVKSVLIPNNLCISHMYDEWRETHCEYPPVQYIADGYFGGSAADFKEIYSKYKIIINARR